MIPRRRVPPRPSLYPKPERLPWREKMTLCLAAEFMRDGESGVIAAYDMNAENEWVGADIQHKGYFLLDDFFFMMAGSISRAIELARCCENVISERQTKGDETLESLQEAVVMQKRKLAAEYVGMRLGMSYEEFFDTGKEKLPEEIFREIITDIKGIGLGCSLLVIDFSISSPTIFRVSDTCVERCSNFAAIGTGLLIAESLLFLREHNFATDVGEALFNAWEAMRLGSLVPGVGETFNIDVLSRKNGKVRSEELTEEHEKYLEKQVTRFSLREPKKIQFKKDDLRPTQYLQYPPRAKSAKAK